MFQFDLQFQLERVAPLPEPLPLKDLLSLLVTRNYSALWPHRNQIIRQLPLNKEDSQWINDQFQSKSSNAPYVLSFMTMLKAQDEQGIIQSILELIGQSKQNLLLTKEWIWLAMQNLYKLRTKLSENNIKVLLDLIERSEQFQINSQQFFFAIYAQYVLIAFYNSKKESEKALSLAFSLKKSCVQIASSNLFSYLIFIRELALAAHNSCLFTLGLSAAQNGLLLYSRLHTHLCQFNNVNQLLNEIKWLWIMCQSAGGIGSNSIKELSECNDFSNLTEQIQAYSTDKQIILSKMASLITPQTVEIHRNQWTLQNISRFYSVISVQDVCQLLAIKSDQLQPLIQKFNHNLALGDSVEGLLHESIQLKYKIRQQAPWIIFE